MANSFYDQIQANQFKSYALAFAVFLLLAGIAWFIGWMFGFSASGAFTIAIVLSMVFTIAGYYFSDSIVLATSGAQPADEKKHIFLINTVEGLAIAAGIPKPRVYVMNEAAINAFATGRDPQHAVIAVTTGALEKLSRTELEGVIAHELSHVKNYDVRFGTIVAVLVGAVVLLAQIAFRGSLFSGGNDSRGKGGAIIFIIGILLVLLAPLFAKLVQLAVSRKREYLADATGAMLTRYPDGLASALEKIKNDKAPALRGANDATAHLYFANPFKLNAESLFSTHPPLEKRIEALRKM